MIYRVVTEIMYVCLDFYLLGIALLVAIFKSLHTLLAKLRVPIPSLATAFLIFINGLLFTYFFKFTLDYYNLLGMNVVNFTEIYETGIELALLFFSVECCKTGTTWLNDIDL